MHRGLSSAGDQKVEIISSPNFCSDESLAELPAELREELSCLGAWVREGRLARETVELWGLWGHLT